MLDSTRHDFAAPLRSRPHNASASLADAFGSHAMQAVLDIAGIKERDLIQALLDSPGSHAIIVTDLNGRVILWNRGAARIFGFSAEEMVNTTAERLFTPEDRANDVIEIEMRNALSKGCAGDFRWHLRKNGTTFWGDGMMYPFFSKAGQHLGYMKILRDATEQKLREDRHEHLAYIDTLTGLPNRTEFHRRLVDMTASAQRHDELLFLHLIDVDRFKQINDTYGHPGGDAFLREAAGRMHGVMRETDLLARLGGDEFAFLQPGGHDIDAGAVVATKFLEAFHAPFDIEGTSVPVTVSIGISVYPNGSTQIEQLIRHADVALYQAKARGRNGYCFFEDSLELLPACAKGPRSDAMLRRD
jgi:diguanylate cyclase (GGDEF)-like protein/PAS domain S-box-containing protein